MVDFSDHYVRERPKNLLSDSALGLAVETYSGWQTVTNVSAVVTTRDVADNDFNLLPNRYVKKDVAPDFDIKMARQVELNLAVLKRSMIFGVCAKFEALLQKDHEFQERSKVKLTRRKLEEVLHQSDLRLSSLNEKNVPLLSLTKTDGLIIQDQRFTELTVVDDLSAYKVVRRGWIVYNPFVIWEGAIHALYDYDVGITSPAYEVWIPQGIDVRYLDFLLKTPRVLNEYARLAGGGVNRRRIVSVPDFKSIEVELPDDNSSKIVAEAMDRLAASVETTVGQAFQKALSALFEA
jgi:hypothetical protein